jgi:hypothetical protein
MRILHFFIAIKNYENQIFSSDFNRNLCEVIRNLCEVIRNRALVVANLSEIEP